MKKFTLIQENYNLVRFSISREEFIMYRKRVEKILLRELYPDRIKYVENLQLLGPLDCEKKEGRDFSIFSKFNTNVTVMKYIVRTFALNSFQELMDLIENRKEELMMEGSSHFNEVWRILKITEEYGDKNEYVSIDYIKNIIKSKLSLDINPIKSKPGTYDDMIYGIDIKFTINGRDFTCQVKPLVSVKESGEELIIESSGNIHNYETDYLSFSNHKTGESILFQNRGVRINGTTLIIPKKYRVLA